MPDDLQKQLHKLEEARKQLALQIENSIAQLAILDDKIVVTKAEIDKLMEQKSSTSK